MKHSRGALVVHADPAPNLRYLQAVGIPALVLGDGVVAYFVVRGVTGMLQGAFDPTRLAALGLLVAALVLGLPMLVVSIRIGPTAVYEDGIDLRDSTHVIGRSFFAWDEFSEARIQTFGRPPAGVTRIVLERRGKHSPITISSAYVDQKFVDELIRFLQRSNVVPSRLE